MTIEQQVSGMHVWLVLWKAYKAMEILDKKSISELGLGGVSEFAILEILYHKGPMPINTIGRKVGLTSGSITTAVDRAAAKKWVARRPDPGDRRVVQIELTETGKEIIECNLARHAANLEQAASVLDQHERKSLVGLLKKLGYHAQSVREGE